MAGSKAKGAPVVLVLPLGQNLPMIRFRVQSPSLLIILISPKAQILLNSKP